MEQANKSHRDAEVAHTREVSDGTAMKTMNRSATEGVSNQSRSTVPSPLDPLSQRRHRASRVKPRLPVIGLVVLTLLLYGRGLSHSRGAAGDSFFHVINGIFIHDAANHPVAALSDPIAYATRYYRHYPAINLGYYPPVFPMIEALLMGLFGVSQVTGQLTVWLMAVVMALLAYAWLKLRFSPWWAAGTAAALVSMPLLVYWGRDTMLEIPTLAFMIGAMWGFERVIREARPSWSSVLLWALFTSLALWTKQHSVLLLGVFAISLPASGRFSHLKNPRVLVAILLIALAAAGMIAMTLRVGGIAVSHTLGVTKQHALDRFNWAQWSYYLRALPDIVGWVTLALAALGLFWVFARREQYVAPLLSWIVVFYVMHSYFKAQTVRYACFWVPPFCVLASVGLRHLRIPSMPRMRWLARLHPRPIATVGMVLWVGASIVMGAVVKTPRVPSVYHRAAQDLCDRLGPFTCLTFFPDRPGRLAVCYRLAVEERITPQRDIDSFGHIVRAGQALRSWKDHWPDVEALNAALRQWNVKYILTETPRPINPFAGEETVAQAVDAVLATGEFRVLHYYPVHLDRKTMADRTMVLYERVTPMQFHPDAQPPLHLARIPITIRSSSPPPSP